MKPQKHSDRITKTNEEIIDSYDYLSNSASTQDCTGLIPSEPVSVSEIESYEELYHFLPPKGEAKNIKTDPAEKA